MKHQLVCLSVCLLAQSKRKYKVQTKSHIRLWIAAQKIRRVVEYITLIDANMLMQSAHTFTVKHRYGNKLT